MVHSLGRASDGPAITKRIKGLVPHPEAAVLLACTRTDSVASELSHNLLLCPSLSHKAQLGGLKPQGDEQTATGATGTGFRCCLLGVDEHRDSDYEEQARCLRPPPHPPLPPLASQSIPP